MDIAYIGYFNTIIVLYLAEDYPVIPEKIGSI